DVLVAPARHRTPLLAVPGQESLVLGQAEFRGPGLDLPDRPRETDDEVFVVPAAVEPLEQTRRRPRPRRTGTLTLTERLDAGADVGERSGQHEAQRAQVDHAVPLAQTKIVFGGPRAGP